MAWVGKDLKKNKQFQAAQCPTEYLQGWSIHSFSGQPVPVSHHPLNKKFPNI